MYTQHFGFHDQPFSIAPNPRYLYMSRGHQEALAHLMYGLQHNGGFILLTGEVGTGKTTICRCLLEQIPEDTDVAFILNPKVTERELLATICDEFHIPYGQDERNLKELIDPLNQFLLENHRLGRKSLLIIDEAQNLPSQVLEQLRLLTNLETNDRKLLQIVLLGQPELNTLLSKPEMRQLAQRITARFHLYPLTLAELEQYLNHRLAVAGVHRPLLTPKAIKALYRHTQGIPRLTNIICDRALLGAYSLGQHQVDHKVLQRAVDEVLGETNEPLRKGFRWFNPALAAALLVLLLGGGLLLSPYGQRMLADAGWEIPWQRLKALTALIQPEANAAGSRSEPADDWNPQLLENLETHPSVRSAWRSLRLSWGLTAPNLSESEACDPANLQGLACLEEVGTWHDLEQLDRPAILHLRAPNGNATTVFLKRLKEEQALLEIAGAELWASKIAITGMWDGRFELLWRPPTSYDKPLRPGDDGPAARSLAQSFQTLSDGGSPISERDDYDAELEELVKQFQLQHNLKPDGIVGPRTLIQISNALGSDSPSLSKQP